MNQYWHVLLCFFFYYYTFAFHIFHVMMHAWNNVDICSYMCQHESLLSCLLCYSLYSFILVPFSSCHHWSMMIWFCYVGVLHFTFFFITLLHFIYYMLSWIDTNMFVMLLFFITLLHCIYLSCCHESISTCFYVTFF